MINSFVSFWHRALTGWGCLYDVLPNLVEFTTCTQVPGLDNVSIYNRYTHPALCRLVCLTRVSDAFQYALNSTLPYIFPPGLVLLDFLPFMNLPQALVRACNLFDTNLHEAFPKLPCLTRIRPSTKFTRGYLVDVSMQGTSVEPDKDDIKAAYGPDVTPSDVLGGRIQAPREAKLLYKQLRVMLEAHSAEFEPAPVLSASLPQRLQSA